MSQKSPVDARFKLRFKFKVSTEEKLPLQQTNVKTAFRCQTLHILLREAQTSSGRKNKHNIFVLFFCGGGTLNRIYHADVVHIKCQEWAALPFKPPHQSTSKQPTQPNSHLLVQFQPRCPATVVLQTSTKNSHNDSRLVLSPASWHTV